MKSHRCWIGTGSNATSFGEATADNLQKAGLGGGGGVVLQTLLQVLFSNGPLNAQVPPFEGLCCLVFLLAREAPDDQREEGQSSMKPLH